MIRYDVMKQHLSQQIWSSGPPLPLDSRNLIERCVARRQQCVICKQFVRNPVNAGNLLDSFCTTISLILTFVLKEGSDSGLADQRGDYPQVGGAQMTTQSIRIFFFYRRRSFTRYDIVARRQTDTFRFFAIVFVAFVAGRNVD